MFHNTLVVGSSPTSSTTQSSVRTGDIGNRSYRRHGWQPRADRVVDWSRVFCSGEPHLWHGHWSLALAFAVTPRARDAPLLVVGWLSRGRGNQPRRDKCATVLAAVKDASRR